MKICELVVCRWGFPAAAVLRRPQQEEVDASGQGGRQWYDRRAMPSITSIRVRLEDTDATSVVHHGSYLTYFAVAWVEYLREQGLPISEVNKRLHLPVVEVLVRYVKPARLDELLEVTSRIGECKRASFTFFYEIRNEAGEMVATGYTRHVCLHPTTTKMIALPDWLKESMPDVALGPADH
jgi:acyl-CoA thioester hydrolase